MLKDAYPYYLANEAVYANRELEVTDKYSGAVATRVAQADARAIDAGIAAATAAQEAMRKFPPFKRQAVLMHCVKRFAERHEEISQALCIEAGKPIKDSRGEVTRLIDTFRCGAEEAVRLGGEVMNLEISQRAVGYRGMWKRVPIGPCSLISPFNFPLNLAAHKIAPAIAAGCPWVLKPSEKTPATSILLGEIIAGTAWPKDAWSILPTTIEDAGAFVSDERAAILSFTGSSAVGWSLRAKAGRKKVALELGGDAACIVDEGADLKRVVARLMVGIYSTSGQSCISVQRILAHRSVLTELREMLVEATKALRFGDPSDEATSVGPLISVRDAERLEKWIGEALAGGASLLTGGRRTGAVLEPTLLENVPDASSLGCQEAFGPIAAIERFDRFEDALARVNRSRFGLQTGIFTNSIERAMLAYRTVEVGAVVINDVPTFRTDAMPYGGVKDSGVGREGVRSAILEFTEPRLLILSGLGRGPVS